MFRKLLFGAIALAGLMIIPTQSVDAGWRRAARRGYYGPYYGRVVYGPRRFNRPYYAPTAAYRAPGYYMNPGYSYGYPGYYGYGPGVGVTTPGFGFYVR